MCRNILKMGKPYKQRHPRTRAQTDAEIYSFRKRLGYVRWFAPYFLLRLVFYAVVSAFAC